MCLNTSAGVRSSQPRWSRWCRGMHCWLRSSRITRARDAQFVRRTQCRRRCTLTCCNGGARRPLTLALLYGEEECVSCLRPPTCGWRACNCCRHRANSVPRCSQGHFEHERRWKSSVPDGFGPSRCWRSSTQQRLFSPPLSPWH